MPNQTYEEYQDQMVANQKREALATQALVQALIADQLSVHEQDFSLLAEKIKAHNDLFDEDLLLQLNSKISTLTTSTAENKQGLADLKTAIDSSIATISTKLDKVETEARTARTSLDSRITANKDTFDQYVVDSTKKDNAQDTSLADYEVRIKGLEGYKLLVDARVSDLESDNTANKSAISQITSTLQTHAKALEDALNRAKTEEKQLRDELVIERERIDALESDAEGHLSRAEASAVAIKASDAGIVAMFAAAGIDRPGSVKLSTEV